MKYDYSKQFSMIEKVPNLTPTFALLKPTTTRLKKTGDMFGFIFFSVCGTLFLYGVFNINPRVFPNDYSVGFRVMPDYITGTNFVAYRRQRKQFILY